MSSIRLMPRRYRWLGAAVTAVVLALGTGAAVQAAAVGPAATAHKPLRWYATWRNAPVQPMATGQSQTGLDDQTVRMVIHTSVGGSSIRLRFSNAYGTTPLVIGQAEVARQVTGPTVAARTQHEVTFGGQESVTVPVGQEVVSDPVHLSVGPLQNLVVSMFVPDATGPTSWHYEAETTSYISVAGNWAAQAGGGPYQTEIPSWFYLDGVDVTRSSLKGTIVAFGDSITDGHYSTIDANGTWPDWLARRLVPQGYAVVNEGIGGNEILTDTASSGVSALHRFARDAVNQLGVTDIIFLEGINDIGTGNTTGPYVSVAQLEAGIEQLIGEAHAAGLKIFGGTLTPFEGASYYTANGEAEREALNKWITTSGAFDGVINFAKAVADPSDPLRLNPVYDTGGGHLHPNDQGYKAMADAINLRFFGASNHG
jgi:lysophospholipase L1-like esterase